MLFWAITESPETASTAVAAIAFCVNFVSIFLCLEVRKKLTGDRNVQISERILITCIE
jgi:hypothetical protein